MASTRRLAAILAADVAGYSRLMGEDEEGTHERLKAHLGELVEPKIAEHRGRIVKNTGDGFLAEFPSVVDAARCAVEIQRGLVDREPEMPEERRIRLRIGINIGDVIVEEHDIFGDSVNMAARLEALAEPGGVLVSNTVYEQVRDRLPYPFEDMGEQQVKNIARPVRVYALRPEGMTELPAPGVLPISAVPQPAVAPRLSIVVLPFTNLSNDPDQQYFADGITEDVTTDLSRIPHMFVISRNTAFAYQGKRLDTKQIGRELGVRYVLEGSVRRLGNQVRVNAQLINAETDAHLWAERFDDNTSDLFALQNQITSRIGIALDTELVTAEAARTTVDPDALDCLLRGRAAFSKPPTLSSLAEAIDWIERALALYPRSAEAQSVLAYVYAFRALGQMTHTRAADIARAEALVAQAFAAAPRSALVHLAKGQIFRAQGRYEEAIPEYETVITYDRNALLAIAALGHCRLATGPREEAIALMEQAIHLSPRDPFIGSWYYAIGRAHLLQSHTDEAVRWLEMARRAHTPQPLALAFLAAAYALKNETARAKAELAEARRLSLDNRYSSIARLKTSWSYALPKIRALYEATFFAGLRKAGMPEE
jgi:adenylate cyclase